MKISEFRSQTKVILVAVIVAFVGLIFFQWGMNITAKIRGEIPPGIIGKVGDEEIKIGDYTQALRVLLSQIAGTPGIKLADSLRQIAWQNLVMDRIYDQLLRKEGLRITTEEIKEIIKSNPPPEIAEMPELRDSSGQFDFSKYHQLLRDPRNIRWIYNYELMIRKEYPKRKLNIALATCGWLTPFEIKTFTRLFSSHFTGVIIQFPITHFVSMVDTSLERMRQYYQNNIEDWQSPQRRQCQFVFFPKTPTKRDTADLKRRLEDLDEDLNAGIDFLTLAQQYSNDPKILLAISELDDKRRKMVRRLKIGAITRTRSDDNHILLKRSSKDSVIRIVLKTIISNETVYDLRSKMESFIVQAKEGGFEQACQEFGLKSNPTYPFSRDEVRFPQLRDPEQLLSFAFKARVGDVSDPLVGRDGYFVFSLSAIIPPQTASFNRVLPFLKSRYLKEKAKEIANKKAWEFYRRLNAGESLDRTIADFPGVEAVRLTDKPLPALKSSYGPEVIGAILALNPGQTSTPITTEWAVYIPILEKIEGKKTSDALQHAIRLRQLRAEYVIQKILDSFEIKDYRTYEIE
ncbi:MAG TPA: hypothetical protein EYP24_00380 [bacterium (Candidatus Stahlbacteria)]|nr:hypothetical protein [Candidatus Stahlbacteria bacterium]